jgi:hypothetical protein
MSAITIQQMAERVSYLLGDRLQARGANLAVKVKSVRLRLPRRVREAATRLAVADMRSHNPKTLLGVDEGAVALDFDVCMRHVTRLKLRSGPWYTLLRVGMSVTLGLLVLATVAFLISR